MKLSAAFSFLLLAEKFRPGIAAAASIALRGNDSNQTVSDHRHRRHLQSVEGIECVTYRKVMMYNDGHTDESWYCEFQLRDAERFFGGSIPTNTMLGIEGMTLEELDARGALSGETVLKLSPSSYVEYIPSDRNKFVPRKGATAATASTTLHISPEDEGLLLEEMDPENDPRHYLYRRMQCQRKRQRGRQLAPTPSMGALNTLVVRVITKDGVEPDKSAAEISSDVFTGKSCLKSQVEACSYSKAIIQPAKEESVVYTGVSYPGIVDLPIDVNARDGDRDIFDEKAWEASVARWGEEMEDFDLALYCQPPTGTDADNEWSAYAYINYKWSMYNNDKCGMVSVQMHEVGHSWGLAHSSFGDKERGDVTGVMGRTYFDEDTKQCYNAAKSFQLGWYDDQADSIDPKTLTEGSPRDYVLNGVADYRENKDALVTLRIIHEGTGGKDYYVGYNRKIGINSDTHGPADAVHVLRKETKKNWNRYGFSWREASLTQGQFYTFEDIGDDTWNLTLFVSSINGRDAQITLTKTSTSPSMPPTAGPTAGLTPGPTPGPPTIPAPTPATPIQKRCRDIVSNKFTLPKIGRVKERPSNHCRWFGMVYKNRRIKRKYCIRKVLITKGPKKGKLIKLNLICKRACMDINAGNKNLDCI